MSSFQRGQAKKTKEFVLSGKQTKQTQANEANASKRKQTKQVQAIMIMRMIMEMIMRMIMEMIMKMIMKKKMKMKKENENERRSFCRTAAAALFGRGQRRQPAYPLLITCHFEWSVTESFAS